MRARRLGCAYGQFPKLPPVQWSSLVNRLTLCLHASWIFVKKSQDPRLMWNPQRYVPVPEHDGMPLMVEYNTDLFDEATIARMVRHLDVLAAFRGHSGALSNMCKYGA